MDRFKPGQNDPPDEHDDVVEQSGHRFAALNWRPPECWRFPESWRPLGGRHPPRGAVLLAAGLAAGLVIGLVGGYTAGKQHGRPPISGTAASSAALTEPGTAALAQTGAECSSQTGRELQLGVQVTNQSATWLTLRYVKAVLPLPGLRAVAVRWATCGAVQDDPVVPGNQVAPGAIAFFTVTFQVLASCPGALPVQFTVGYSQNGHVGSASLPGFPDLSHVPYSGCPPPPGS